MMSPPIQPGNESVPAAGSEPGQHPEVSPYARRVKLYSMIIYLVARLIYATMRMHIENFERLMPNSGVQQGKEEPGTGIIQVTWHGRTLIPANLLRNRGYWALISLSRDGELQNHVFKRFGFQTVRGSTGRGGVRGALQMARKVREGAVLAFTPDGPRGPSHKVQLGVILMAEKSGAPIIPVGISASRRWLVKSWDRFLVPKPFSRGYFIVGDPIHIPSGLNDAQREAWAEQVEIALNRLEKEAERRAGHLDYPAEWRTE